MINSDRLTKLFAELVSIDSPSRGERGVCDALIKKLNDLGVAVREDDAAGKIGGSAGNLYAYVPGKLDLPPILLSAHTDTVEPSCNKHAVIHDDGTITSDGTTVLGADDLSGVCAIIEALTSVIEDGKEHRPIEIVFDAAEETYCTGIQQFDFNSLKSKDVYVLDMSGDVGTAAYQAPSIISFKAEIEGLGAHAAFTPELGIHAIKTAADAISAIQCGHVSDTTVNVGTITGGSADNVVPAHCTVTGEVRSFDDGSARRQLEIIKAEFLRAGEKFGAKVDFTTETLCLAYKTDTDDLVVRRFQSVCRELGLKGELTVTYGGSDNNHYANRGFHGLVAASGMNNCHSCKESTTVNELVNSARLAEGLILSKE